MRTELFNQRESVEELLEKYKDIYEEITDNKGVEYLIFRKSKYVQQLYRLGKGEPEGYKTVYVRDEITTEELEELNLLYYNTTLEMAQLKLIKEGIRFNLEQLNTLNEVNENITEAITEYIYDSHVQRELDTGDTIGMEELIENVFKGGLIKKLTIKINLVDDDVYVDVALVRDYLNKIVSRDTKGLYKTRNT